MKNACLQMLASALLVLVPAATWATTINNGRFETGDFSDWFSATLPYSGSLPYYAIVDNAYFPAIEGRYSALIVSLNTQVPELIDDPWSTHSVSYPVAATPVGTGRPFAPFQQPAWDRDFNRPIIFTGDTTTLVGHDLLANAGDIIAFDWRWFANDDPCPRSGGDDAFLEATNGSSAFVTLLDGACAPATAPLATGFDNVSAVRSTFLELPMAGPWTLYIGVTQGADTFASSGLLFDNVRISRRLAEPTTLALVVLAFCALAFGTRKHCKCP